MAGEGQFKRSDLGSFYTTVSMSMGTISVPNTSLTDTAGTATLQNQTLYCVSFSVSKTSVQQNFYIVLKNTQNGNWQRVKEFKIPIGTGTVSLDATFKTNFPFNRVVWQLKRDNTNSYSGVKVSVSNTTLLRVKDILQQSIFSQIDSLKSIKVAGPPGLLMCINGEHINVGKTGIYTLNHKKILIKSIGFIPKTISNNLQFFIMDYEY